MKRPHESLIIFDSKKHACRDDDVECCSDVVEQQFHPGQPAWPERQPYPTDPQNGLIPECGACTIEGGCRCVGEKGSRVSSTELHT